MVFNPQNPFELVEQILTGGMEAMARGPAQGMQAAYERSMQVPEAEQDTELARRISNQITNDLQQHEDVLVEMIARRAPQEDVARQRAVVGGLRELQGLPTAMLPQAYQEFRQAQVGQEMAPFEPAGPPAPEFGPRFEDGGFLPPFERPQFPAGDVTAAQQMAAGPSMAASLIRRDEAVADEVQHFIGVLGDADPTRPDTVVRALLRADTFDVTRVPSHMRARVDAELEQLRQWSSHPDVRDAYETALRMRDAESRSAVAGATRAEMDVEQLKLMNPLRVAELTNEITQQGVDAVLEAHATGILAGVRGNEEWERELAAYWGVSVGDLERAAKGRRERLARMEELGDEAERFAFTVAQAQELRDQAEELRREAAELRAEGQEERADAYLLLAENADARADEMAEVAKRHADVAEGHFRLAVEGNIRARSAHVWDREKFLDWQRRADVDYSRLVGQVGDEAANRIGMAMETGVMLGLNDEEKAHLARLLNVEAGELPAAMREIVERNDEIDALNLQSLRLQNDVLEQNLELGEITIDLRTVQLTSAQWQSERDVVLAELTDGRNAAQDELSLASGLANAAAQGETEMMMMYLAAWEDPDSALGAKMRTVLGEDGAAILAGFESTAEAIRDRDERRIEIDDSYREVLYDDARESLAQDRELRPLETRALSAIYELDRKRALADIQELASSRQIDATMALTRLAEAVPPAYWDDLSPEVLQRVETLKIPIDDLRARSELAQWIREDPRAAVQRERGMDLFDALMRAAPEEGREALALEGVGAALDLLGITDAIARGGFLTSAVNIWGVRDAEQRGRLAIAALNEARLLELSVGPEGYSLSDARTLSNLWSGLATSYRDELQRFDESFVSGSGCQHILDLAQFQIRTERSDPSQRVTTVPGYSTCGEIYAAQEALYEGGQVARGKAEEWALNATSLASEEGPGVSGRTPPPAASGTPAPEREPVQLPEDVGTVQPPGYTGVPAAREMPSALTVDGFSTQLTPHNKSLARAAGNALLSNDTEAAEALREDFMGKMVSAGATNEQALAAYRQAVRFFTVPAIPQGE